MKIIWLLIFMLACSAGAADLPLLDRSNEPLRIMNWWSPVREALTEKQVDLMVDSGLNFLLFMGYSPEHCKRALGFASKYPWVEAIVWDERIFGVSDLKPESFARIDDVVRDYKSYSAFKGFVVRDEPPTAEYTRLGKIFGYTREHWPGVIPYVNLYPNYVNAPDVGAESYADYVRRYIALRPPMVSYDHYPFPIGGMSDVWFSNLEEVRGQCLAAGIPPWVIVQFSAWPGMRAANEGELRYCVYSALAYGFRGICYFCYATPEKVFSQCAVEFDGSVNKERFALLKKVNKDISTHGPVLMALTSRRVYHTEPLPKGTQGIPSDGRIRSFSRGEWVVGEMQGRLGSYVMVVNRDCRKSQKASVHWSPDIKAVYRVSPRNLALEPIALGKEKTSAINLDPGDGALFCVTQ